MGLSAIERAELVVFFKGQSDPLKKGFKDVKNEAQNLQTSIEGLGSTLKGLAGVYISVQAAQRALQLAKLGEDLEAVQNGFNNIVGNGPQNLARARAAVKGTIDDLRLMRLASEGVQAGLDFSQVLQILEFAEYRAGQFGDSFDSVFNKITQNLSLMQRGLAVSDRSFNQLQLSGKNTTDVLQSMADQMSRAAESGSMAGNSMARFEANVKNLQLEAGKFLKTVLSPLVELLNIAATTLANRANPLAASALQIQQATGQPLTFNLKDNDREALAKFFAGFDDEKLQAIFAGLRLQTQVLASSQRQALENLRDQIDLEIAVAQERGQSEQDYIVLLNERKAVRDQLAALNEQDAEKAKAEADQVSAATREKLDQERQLLEAKIANGQATYEDFRNLLDKQFADNQQFIDNDIAAFIAYINARARLRSEDARKRDADEAEIYNTTRRFVDYTLADSARSKTQRIADAYTIWQETLKLENLSVGLRRQILAEMGLLERDFSSIVDEEAQRRVDFLQSIFGNTFLQIFDDILDGSQKRFEEYLGELGKALLRFLASQALLKLFAILAGGPFAGLFGGGPTGGRGGTVGGGIRGGGGILSLFHRIDPNQILRGGINAVNAYRDVSPVYNPTIQNSFGLPPVHVELLLDNYGLAARVKQGQKQYNRSAGS